MWSPADYRKCLRSGTVPLRVGRPLPKPASRRGKRRGLRRTAAYGTERRSSVALRPLSRPSPLPVGGSSPMSRLGRAGRGPGVRGAPTRGPVPHQKPPEPRLAPSWKPILILFTKCVEKLSEKGSERGFEGGFRRYEEAQLVQKCLHGVRRATLLLLPRSFGQCRKVFSRRFCT